MSPTNNSTYAIPPLSGKPPMSSKSKYSSVKDSIKTAHSMKSPTGSDKGGAGLREPSPRPQVLAPIANPPQLPANTSNQVLPHDPSADSIGNTETYTMPGEKSTDETNVPASSSVEEPEAKQTDTEDVKYEEIKIKWTPLLDKSEKVQARDYGHSFGSKKVAMGPGFMNLRFMCHCLARAIKRHLEFSKGVHWFLQDLQASEADDDLEFSYQLPSDLKLTINPKGHKVCASDEDDDINPFQREETSGDFKEIDEEHINIDSKGLPSSNPDMFGKLRNVGTKNLGEPEPEQTVFSDEESKSSAQKQPSTVSQPGRLSNSVNN